jgi:kynureninase
MVADPLLVWRDQFPILSECTYLVSHSLGAMPRQVYDSLQNYADTWGGRGVRAWGEAWWDLNGAVGDKVGRIINAPPKTVSMHENLSIALSILLSALPFDTRRPKVIVDDMIFPTDFYVLTQMLPPEVELHVVRSRDGMTVPTEDLLAAIDERTALVVVNQVLFRSGYIMPAADIITRAHAVGAQVLLDAYHSVGIIPVDVTALEVDYLIGGTLKWVCGGPGGVFMYVRPDLLPTLQPKITGWFAHKRPFAFEVDRIEWRDDAYRMLNGTFGVASLYAIQPGIDTIAAVGVEQIRAKSQRQTALLIELAQAAGFEVRTPLNPAERGGMVTIVPDHAYEVSRALLERNILIDYRENAGIRVAPHFYNSDDEVRLVISAIVDILRDGSWQQHTAGRAFVT